MNTYAQWGSHPRVGVGNGYPSFFQYRVKDLVSDQQLGVHVTCASTYHGFYVPPLRAILFDATQMRHWASLSPSFSKSSTFDKLWARMHMDTCI